MFLDIFKGNNKNKHQSREDVSFLNQKENIEKKVDQFIPQQKNNEYSSESKNVSSKDIKNDNIGDSNYTEIDLFDKEFINLQKNDNFIRFYNKRKKKSFFQKILKKEKVIEIEKVIIDYYLYQINEGLKHNPSDIIEYMNKYRILTEYKK